MSFDSLLNQSVSIQNTTSKNAFNEETLGSSTVELARVEPSNQMLFDDTGEEITADAVFFLQPDTTAQMASVITHDSTTYRIFRIKSIPGMNGIIHHVEAVCKITV